MTARNTSAHLIPYAVWPIDVRQPANKHKWSLLALVPVTLLQWKQPAQDHCKPCGCDYITAGKMRYLHLDAFPEDGCWPCFVLSTKLSLTLDCQANGHQGAADFCNPFPFPHGILLLFFAKEEAGCLSMIISSLFCQDHRHTSTTSLVLHESTHIEQN